jgi:hypothetical protein
MKRELQARASAALMAIRSHAVVADSAFKQQDAMLRQQLDELSRASSPLSERLDVGSFAESEP